MLEAAERPLVESYDLAMFDLDGVVYVGDHAVPGAPAHLARVRESDMHVAFITNNASRTPAGVVERLAGVGVHAVSSDVVTSAQAAAHVLTERFGTGVPVAVLGVDGLVSALEEVGLVPVAVTDDRAVAVVSGYGPDVPWRDVMRAAIRIRDGLPWVASNTDLTFPTSDGPAPGHGVMVDMLSRFTGVVPEVAGKPQRPLLDETVRRVGGDRPLMVGDRLDTDIEGATNSGIDSLLVMTGVTGVAELVAALPEHRPTFVAADLGGLFEPHRVPAEGRLGGWTASVSGNRLEVSGEGTASDWWRVVAEMAWTCLDETGEPVDTAALVPPAPERDR